MHSRLVRTQTRTHSAKCAPGQERTQPSAQYLLMYVYTDLRFKGKIQKITIFERCVSTRVRIYVHL